MADFRKPAESSPNGYDLDNKGALWRLKIPEDQSRGVVLWGSGAGGEKLRVELNNPSIATISEEKSPGKDLRMFRLSSKKVGNAMLEAKNSKGHVWAFIQVVIMRNYMITSIPKIMRSKGWLNGARLLEIWFSRPSAVAPSYSHPDTATIRMDSWALTFPRAKQVYDQLIRERIWANPPAQHEIAKMLRRNKMLPETEKKPYAFGNLKQSVEVQDHNYINQRVVKFSLLSDLDDMSAALGNFAFRVVVAGSVALLAKKHKYQVTITTVGVYIRDSFDFNGDQVLGFWDSSDNSVSKTNPLSGTQVSNADFRNWRTDTGKGGDFLVFSDVKQTKLPKPDIFEI